MAGLFAMHIFIGFIDFGSLFPYFPQF